MATIVITVNDKKQLEVFSKLAQAFKVKANLLVTDSEKEDFMLGKLMDDDDCKIKVSRDVVFKKLKSIQKHGS